jgi:DNA-directed RNA polymerase specialized sigma24 family protein
MPVPSWSQRSSPRTRAVTSSVVLPRPVTLATTITRHAWRRHPPSADELTFDELPDRLAPKPGEQAERREQLAALTKAIEHDLTPRQREVFVAIARRFGDLEPDE